MNESGLERPGKYSHVVLGGVTLLVVWLGLGPLLLILLRSLEVDSDARELLMVLWFSMWPAGVALVWHYEYPGDSFVRFLGRAGAWWDLLRVRLLWTRKVLREIQLLALCLVIGGILAYIAWSFYLLDHPLARARGIHLLQRQKLVVVLACPYLLLTVFRLTRRIAALIREPRRQE